jgi:hypothetical protein
MPEKPCSSNTLKQRYPPRSSFTISVSTASNMGVVSLPVFVFWREQW